MIQTSRSQTYKCVYLLGVFNSGAGMVWSELFEKYGKQEAVISQISDVE